MEEASKQYTAFTVGSLGSFNVTTCLLGYVMCWPHSRGWCKTASTSWTIYCLIYLDDVVVFLLTAEEHLHQLQVVFDQFREDNLKLKPSKCSFLKRRSTIWGIGSPRKVYDPVTWIWRQFQNVRHPKHTWKCRPSLALWTTTEGS